MLNIKVVTQQVYHIEDPGTISFLVHQEGNVAALKKRVSAELKTSLGYDFLLNLFIEEFDNQIQNK